MDIEQKINGHDIVPFNSNNQLNLLPLDCVLVRQIRSAEEYWAPGLVLYSPSSLTVQPVLYRIQVYDPLQREIGVYRKDLIRITRNLCHKSIVRLQKLNKNFIRHSCIIHCTHEKTSSINQTEIETTIRRVVDSLKEKVEDLSRSYDTRYYELKQILEDHMNAIRILQDYRCRCPPPPPPPPPPPRRPSSHETSPSSDSHSKTTTRTDSPKSIEPGTIVYALWSDDDGFVYRGKVLRSVNSDEYRIERIDLPGVKSNISRDDIFLESKLCQLKELPNRSFVLIKNPKDSRDCYYPSVIIEQLRSESRTKVRFYDCVQKPLDDDELVIPIKEKQFQHYTEKRIEKETSLIEQVIVGFNGKTGTHMLGTIKSRLENGHKYEIEWYNESQGEQEEEFLFGAFIRRNRHYEYANVLAIDDDDKIYKPAQIVSISNDKETVHVKYFNKNEKTLSERTAHVPAITTFVISEEYLDKVIEHNKNKHL